MRYLEIPYKQSILRGTIFGTIDPRVICIHGASQEGAARYDALRHHLAKVGIASLSFDFIGAGETGGDMRTSSLKNRLESAWAVIDQTSHQEPLTIIGASMGADTAIRLSEKYPTSALVLFVPGVYARAAFTAPFNEEFTRILHEERSWEDSESFDILSRFEGSLLIIGAENDAVVPREILDRLMASAGQAKRRELYMVPRSSHEVLPYLSQHGGEFARVFEKVYHAVVGIPGF